MSGIFSKPKAPAIEATKEIPVADDAIKTAYNRRQQATRARQQGVLSTQLSDNQAQPMQNKPVGQ
jgi:hypothetical protein